MTSARFTAPLTMDAPSVSFPARTASQCFHVRHHLSRRKPHSAVRHEDGMKGGHTVKRITTDELRTMTDREGLILQGCGGELSEWVNGINELLTQERYPAKRRYLQGGFSFSMTAAPICCFPWKMWICIWESSPYGVCSHTVPSAALG